MKTILLSLISLTVGGAALACPIPSLPPVDNGLTVTVPNIGITRVETHTYCLSQAGVDRYQDLITDSHHEFYERCLIELT